MSSSVTMKFLKAVILLWFVITCGAQATGLEFKELFKELQPRVDVASVTADFEFTNKTEKSVTITKSDAGCSCLKVQVSDGKLMYAPGESGFIRATFDMGNFSGTVDKMIAIWLDDDAPGKPSMTLTVRIHIPVLVNLEPKTVKWEIGGSSEPQTIKVRMTGDKPIAITGVQSTSEAFSCEFKTLVAGKEYDLVVTPKVTDSPGMAVIRIETDCEVAKFRTQQAFGVVSKASPAKTAVKP